MLKQRIVTGLLLAAVVLTAILWLPARWLVGAFALVTIIAYWEWGDLAGISSRALRTLYCLCSAAAIGGLALLVERITAPGTSGVRIVLLLAAVWWSVALVFVMHYPRSASHWNSIAARLVMGWLVLLPAWVACAYLRLQPNGEWLILYLLVLVAAADIGAYFAGTAFGRRKLAPAVSPGKSWEGFCGGLALSLLFATAVHHWFWQQLPLPQLLLISAAAVLASVVGDLFESMIKRQRGVKDSSDLLPGHGGVMDRLDSISAAAPLFALGLLLAVMQ